MITLFSATRIAVWIGDLYDTYMVHLGEGGDIVEYIGNRSGDWDSNGVTRVSKLAKNCPKFDALVNKELIDPVPFTFADYARFEDGVRIAQEVYEAVEWGAAQKMGYPITFQAEHRVKEHWTGLAGTVDGVLDLFYEDTHHLFPIEVKRTDIDKWGFLKPCGISYEHMLQVIGEMVLLGTEDWGDCPYGFLFTRYSTTSEPYRKVWTVVWRPDFDGWMLYDGNQAVEATGKEWPTLPDGRILVSRAEYIRMKLLYEQFQQAEHPLELEAPYEFLSNWKCAKVVQPKFYAEGGKYKGAKKDGTGKVIVRCPAWSSCFRKELDKAGLTAWKEEYDLEDFNES